MKSRLCFVQFPHPGKEHEPDSDCVKVWNCRKEHRRKFLRCEGRYVEDPKDKREKAGRLGFWGEWEPQSKATHALIPTDSSQGLPKYIYDPCYALLDSGLYDGRQNTDPYVFGRKFLYACCRQHAKRGPTQLRDLKKGSVILFGSCPDIKSGKFVLDTVFVVGDSFKYNKNNYERELKPKVARPLEIYVDVTLQAIFKRHPLKEQGCENVDREYRLYEGASFEERTSNGMFSFFPCKLLKGEEIGFPRPEIRIEGPLKDMDAMRESVCQGRGRGPYFRARGKEYKPEEIKALWDQIVQQVKGDKLLLGTYAEEPKKCTRPGNMCKAASADI